MNTTKKILNIVILTIVEITICVLIISNICFFIQVDKLNDIIKNNNNEIYDLKHTVLESYENSIYKSFGKISSEDSWISEYNIFCTNIDYTNSIIDFEIRVTPKTSSEELEIYFSYDDNNSIKLKKEGTSFNGEFPLSVLNNFDLTPKLIFKNSLEERTEGLEDIVDTINNIENYYFLNINVEPISYKFSSLINEFKIKKDYKIRCSCYDNQAKIVNMIFVKNGVCEKKYKLDSDNSINNIFMAEIDYKTKFKEGDTLEIKIEINDNRGYTYRLTLGYLTYKDGKLISNDDETQNYVKIFDTDNNDELIWRLFEYNNFN
ncbi:MAG: hypothetical protein RSD67_03750 [Oscillospiraceae bacterium]